MKNNPKIDCYRTEAVHTVLKRYDFSKHEKQIIQYAILSAKRDIPDMKAIDKADALLKMVASSREPIEEKEDPIERVKNIVRLDANPRKSLYSGLSQSSNYGFSHTTIFSIFAYSAGISKLFPSR